MENKNVLESLEGFWSKRKDSLTIIGLVATIGTLFLTIETPDIEQAKSALRMVQFLWLVALTLGAGWLCWSLVQFTFKFEESLSKKISMDLGSYISGFVILFTAYLIYNLWSYMTALYRDEWIQFIGATHYLCASLIAVVYIALLNRLFDKHWSVSKINLVFNALLYNLAVSVILTLWTTILKLDNSADLFLRTFYTNFLIYTVAAFGIIGFLAWMLEKRKKKDATNSGGEI